MIDENKKYWDGNNKNTIIECEVLICDLCKIKYEFYVGQFFGIPPAGIIIGDGQIFICGNCIDNYFFSKYDLLTILFDLKKRLNNNLRFGELLYDSVKHFLPNIFLLKRKTISRKIRSMILKKYNYKCIKCGSTENLTLDHIKPFSRNGTDDENNLQILCKKCNSKKGSRIESDGL